MRYSYATVSLPTLTPAEAVVELRESGFEGVEWKVGDAPHAAGSNAADFLLGNRCTLAPTLEAAEEAARLCAQQGLAVVGLTPYVSVGDVEGMRLVLDMADRAGAPQVRLQAQRVRDGESYRVMRDDLVRFLDACLPDAHDRGVRILIEIHHRTIVPSVGLAMPILDHFDDADLGVIYDVGNMVYEGYEDYRIGLELLGSRLRHVHLKNVGAVRTGDGSWRYEWTRLDDGLVDASHVLALLDEAGYSGWVSIEDLATYADSRDGIRYNAEVLGRVAAPGWRGGRAAPEPSRP
ncbi:xylose isomerase [Microbacterium sp. Y-01]|uniref:sugar phosphate isomerase/epimerase family protein n=1 Tax=Microbacterium sp. Y-01 TaxID=2048898 RepID=UPI000F5D6AF2|nr:sugar phosphate isomerase/epimerase [Microbacterium sp. Y-01]AZH79020.1 xylose isomerase [Microbacterium sp. Y-01]